jgi:hypothetical protein
VSVNGNQKLGPSQDIRTRWTSHLPPTAINNMPRAKKNESVHFAPGTITTPVKKSKKQTKQKETMNLSDDEGSDNRRRSKRTPTPRKGPPAAKSTAKNPTCACRTSPPLDHDRVSPSDLSYVLCCLFKLYSYTQTQVSVRERCAPSSVRAKREGR